MYVTYICLMRRDINVFDIYVVLCDSFGAHLCVFMTVYHDIYVFYDIFVYRGWDYKEVFVQSDEKWQKKDILKLDMILKCQSIYAKNTLIWIDTTSNRKLYSPACCKRYNDIYVGRHLCSIRAFLGCYLSAREELQIDIYRICPVSDWYVSTF